MNATTSVDAGDDLSALAWVQEELRRSLEAAHKALRRFVKDTESLGQSDIDAVNPAVLRTARTSLHQGVGALALIGLPTAAEVQKRLSFPLSGTDETPGVITMTLDGRGLDPRWRTITVVFNATPSAARQTVPAARGATMVLHPVLAGSADAVVRSSAYDKATGTFVVPPRTVAVFVQPA